jgi:hypothetical protein
MSLRDRMNKPYVFKNPKTFVNQLVYKLPVEQVTTETSRHYVTPLGDHYFSVTTLLKEMKDPADEKALESWRARVGHAEAKFITDQAATRGTRLHRLCESYFLQTPVTDKISPLSINLFNQLKPLIDAHVTTVRGIEIPLFSDVFKVAGTADLFCDWDGISSIVDLKTARSFKKPEQIKAYFHQATMYGLMIEELYGIAVPQIVILIGHQFDTAPQLFVKPLAEFKDKATKQIAKALAKIAKRDQDAA